MKMAQIVEKLAEHSSLLDVCEFSDYYEMTTG